MDIQRIPVSRINPAKYNPRKDLKPGDPEYEKLARSIREFGFVEPLVWNKRTGNLVGGHQRLKILLTDGVTDVECSVVDLDGPREKALNVALNKIGGEWNIPKLRDLLADIQASGIDAALTGFDAGEIDRLLKQTSGKGDDNQIPRVPENSTTKPGDLWQIGPHRILCGDSTKADDIAKLLDDAIPDVVVYDPPYDMAGAYNYIPSQGIRLLVFWDCLRFADAAIGADRAGWKPLWEFVWDCQTSWYVPNRPLMRHKACGVWGREIGGKWLFDAAIYDDGKNRMPKVVSNTRGGYEYVPDPRGVHLQTVFSRAITKEFAGHEHAKPVDWIAALLAGCGGKIVLDLFGGGGSTILAAERNGQEVRMMEIDPQYCDVIIERARQALGVEPERVDRF